MADLPPYPDSNGDTKNTNDAGRNPGPASAPSTPLWVKVFGVTALVLVLLIIILMLAGGEHGPGRHMSPGGGLRDRTPPHIIMVYSMQKP